MIRLQFDLKYQIYDNCSRKKDFIKTLTHQWDTIGMIRQGFWWMWPSRIFNFWSYNYSFYTLNWRSWNSTTVICTHRIFSTVASRGHKVNNTGTSLVCDAHIKWLQFVHSISTPFSAFTAMGLFNYCIWIVQTSNITLVRWMFEKCTDDSNLPRKCHPYTPCWEWDLQLTAECAQ